MDIIIEQLTIEHPYYSQVYNLREEILRKPIGLSLKDEDLSIEELDTTLAAIYCGKVIGCVMLRITYDSSVFKLRQMAVNPEWQRKGIGSKLVSAAEELLRRKHIRKIILHARVTASGFYSKLGYTITSNTFTEVGIPHVAMEKTL